MFGLGSAQQDLVHVSWRCCRLWAGLPQGLLHTFSYVARLPAMVRSLRKPAATAAPKGATKKAALPKAPAQQPPEPKKRAGPRAGYKQGAKAEFEVHQCQQAWTGRTVTDSQPDGRAFHRKHAIPSAKSNLHTSRHDMHEGVLCA